MFNKRTILSSMIVAVGSVQAVSPGCTTSIAGLAFGDLGSCLQLTNALQVFTGSGAIVSSVNSYLDSLCASGTPTCASGTLTSAKSTIQSACASDLSNGGIDGATVTALEGILDNYSSVRTAACSKNSTTGDFCVTDTLYTIQNISGTDLTSNDITHILSGTGSTDLLNNAVNSGQLCTGCVSEIYHQALQANQTLAQGTVGQALTSQCGANFGSADASGVSTPSSAATSNAAASTSASGAAGVSASFDMAPWLFAIGTITLGAAVGGAAVL